MIHFWQSSRQIRQSVFIPKYYAIDAEIQKKRSDGTNRCQTIAELVNAGVLSVCAGDEIGKMAYGTGDIPFVRTSDIANWEIKSFPKQGVSASIYEKYAEHQDVTPGDILFVRDGTYLIGNNCFIQDIDKEILYQSHVLKLRVNKKDELNPYLLFLALNSPSVQAQIRSKQFTADTIDTLGDRFFELTLSFPHNQEKSDRLVRECKNALTQRMVGKAFVKNFPTMMEDALRTGSEQAIVEFIAKDTQRVVDAISNKTITAELGGFFALWRSSKTILNDIYLPTYYADDIRVELEALSRNCDLRTIKDLSDKGEIEYQTGDEVGKMAYGTGSVPFVRTSDFSNWEILHHPKQGVAEDIYQQHSKKQDVREHDVFLVRDGTYLVGSSCIVTKQDEKILFCGGMFKFRILKGNMTPFLFLGLLNSWIVKRQIRTKQFTRDVIDTLGSRIEEVVLPVPKDARLRTSISAAIEHVVKTRIAARAAISRLSAELE